MTTFKDLSIGDLFILTGVQTSTVVFKKTMEDGEHNAVWHNAEQIGEDIPDDMPVAKITQVTTPILDHPVLYQPKYMFAERPVTPSTWIDLQNMQLDTYMLEGRTGLLIDPVTREYCYVYWDEGDQCSNPYATHAEAIRAGIRYSKSL